MDEGSDYIGRRSGERWGSSPPSSVSLVGTSTREEREIREGVFFQRTERGG